MQIVDAVHVADARNWLLDRTSLLVEIVTLDQDCVRFEQQHGRHAEVAEFRRRLRVQRARVLEQLYVLLDGYDRTTVH